MRIADKAFAKALLNLRDNSLVGKLENNMAYIYSCHYAGGQSSFTHTTQL